ncbi:2'-5' RNA ligase family protein [Novosphingobium arvoryzae]|uniref:2'-5' RNA ligase family protein n=1 Tax=Novosphingobium arvoryzae TaxID=1256514 RepID=UPI0035AF0116
MASQPFIVTAELPPDLFKWADALRRTHFPPERNWLQAHVTLFHSFAPSLRRELPALLARIAAELAAPSARIDGLMDLGQGTALAIASPPMLAIRERIAEHFHGALTAQDQHPPRLHITIQNKVTREAARALQAELGRALESRRFRFTGLGLHLYCNPHWQAQGTWRFRGKEGG